MSRFRRVLVANRGEIAIRIIRALRTLGIESVAVFSNPDSKAPHVAMAEKAFNLSGVFSSETYLNGAKLVEIARKSDCDAIHPGYGFLSESADFSKLCSDNSIKFVGPRPDTLVISGNKLECKKLVESKGVPVIPYTREPLADVDEASRLAKEIGFPVLLKSAFGGGGKGIREANSTAELKEAFDSAKREAESSFGRFAPYIEKKLVNPRHIEVQILASDDSQQFIHLGERECSIQRRYQKLIEISPSPVVNEEIRRRITSYAISVADAVRYSNAGTVEFLRDSATGNFYFIEVNSRLQVEHPVTEAVTGIDLVCSQLHVAETSKLPVSQEQVEFRGAAIECRINAEDPLSDFSPTTGTVEFLHFPGGPGIRIDSALQEGADISPYYDSLIAKLIAHGSDFDEARRRSLTALEEFSIVGVKTTIPFHREVMLDKRFSKGEIDTGFLESSGIVTKIATTAEPTDDEFAVAALLLSRDYFGLKKQAEPSADKPTWLDRKTGRFVDAL
ncbi:MAG: acetyl-CoA carboxylase biotin carboxylase subunit [Nitrososphaerota archaeon]|nr:acetyl-CoA carboxylase biotin carboxylase subunit [Nitrososphaerota archaeon]